MEVRPPTHTASGLCVLPVITCRLDNMTGTGVHLNLQGVNFDQRVISLGKVPSWTVCTVVHGFCPKA